MTNSNTMLDWALFYAQQMGLRVFPLTERDKKPLPGTAGFKDAVTDEATIRKWWKAYPKANIGIATGKMADGSFLTVIDIDNNEEKGKNGLEVILKWEDKNDLLPDTLVSKTGSGGMHYFYRT